MYKGLMLAKAIMAFIQTTNNPPKVGEGVVKGWIVIPGKAKVRAEAQFTRSK
jgi:hypothetical protein